MTTEEYQWYIKAMRDRYHYLNLDYEQAEKVYKYEQENNHHFSVWEGWDYEWTTFREILSEDQFKTYETFLRESIEGYQQALVKQDNENSNDITHYEELINFYETRFLPDFFKDPYMGFGWLLNDSDKIEYLRKEYKRFLVTTKEAVLANHFRQNRTFKPNELKASLLRHRLSCILPDYTAFKHQMDEPTRAVAHYLKSKLRYFIDDTDELLTRKFKELNEFIDTSVKKHYSEIRGWHVPAAKLSDEEEKENRIMTLLLVENERYGIATDNK